MMSVGEQDTLAEQLGLGPSVHLSLDHLDAVDVALDGARAPGQGEASGDGGPVLAQAGGEAAEFRDVAGFSLVGPAGELVALAVGEHVGELADERARGGELGAAGGDGVQGGAVLGGELAGRGQDPGGHLLRRRRGRACRGDGVLAQGGRVAAEGPQAAAVAAAAELFVQLVGPVAAFVPALVQPGQVRVQEACAPDRGVWEQAVGVGGGV
jgi:hypothetical protein